MLIVEKRVLSMGEAPGGTPGPKRWGRQGEQVSLSTFRQRVGLRSEGRLIFPSSDLRVAGGARKDPEAAVTRPRNSNSGASRERAEVGSRCLEVAGKSGDSTSHLDHGVPRLA